MKATFSLSDVLKSFTKLTLKRGEQYFRDGMVEDALYDQHGTLTGWIAGSGLDSYLVKINGRKESGFIRLYSFCECPVTSQCKHGVALALYALRKDLRVETITDDEEEFEAAPTEEQGFVVPKAPTPPLDIYLPPELRDWLRHVESSVAKPVGLDPAAKQHLFYRLHLRSIVPQGMVPVVTTINRSLLKSGGYGTASEVKDGSLNAYQKPKHWTALDQVILSDLVANAPRADHSKAEFRLDGRHGSRLIREILDTGRCQWADDGPLTFGETRKGLFEWKLDERTKALTPTFKVEGFSLVLPAEALWYVDRDTRECGLLESEVPPGLAATLVRMGPILPEHQPEVRAELQRIGVPEEMLPVQTMSVTVRAPEPVICIFIDFEACSTSRGGWNAIHATAPIAFAKLWFEYEGIKAPADGSDIRIADENELTLLRRNIQAERLARDVLSRWKWQDAASSIWQIPKGRGTSMRILPSNYQDPFEPIEKVTKFVQEAVPVLQEAGWKIDIDETYRFVPDEAVEWDIALESSSGIDWFQFQLGIRVEGEPFDLRSVLGQLLKEERHSAWQSSDDLYVFGLNGRIIKLSRKRLTAILQPLVEIFGDLTSWPEELRLSKASMPVISKFEARTAEAEIPWKTTDELRRLNQQFKNFERLEPLPEPDGFKGDLRAYQREGLAWLQFLREFGFGGVLADDMGLGKTVQILAHVQTEKASGRMDRPCLIVAPTSTMPNWRRECERFTPHLKVITLQGGKRSTKFSELKEADIALTTYPLLARDREHLSKADYHLIVLDEAQNIKNPITAAAKAARELTARHRICLSGTPVENHLGELWSLFQFLMPGFLGVDAEFKRQYRVPIEKGGDAYARESLARRIRPFMLRRTKNQVLKDLPPKTEIIETIDFEDPQRDLYESIRVAMDKQVRELIEAQGFNKSRIQILDALLKLRQVCCDPRLVKLPSAQAVTATAKLDRLMEMLGILIEEGRRVLVFSQFTSMLNLIEVRLKEASISWVRISGDTEDRETPVKRFQAGEVPLFLISLKAGGTGLNLTAADTVILYDPWWNPAVENQAIDRAHRIGQEKSVTVYKLVAAATIEEKMLEMQARKGDIARSILTDDAEGIKTLTADDLRWVLS